MATTLTQKLQLKPGQTVKIVNAPQGYLEKLAADLEGVTIADPAAGLTDGALVFVNNLEEAGRLGPESVKQIRPDGLLWVAYPKGGSKIKTDVNRDKLWPMLEPTGWRPVRQVALDEVWSAMRFRPADKVGR